MAINDDTLELIKSFEGFVPNWYPDPAHGWKLPTVGYGHTDAAGEPKYAATKDKRFSEAEASAMLERDLAKYEAAVRSAVQVPLNENQYGALVSFTYNLGAGNLNKSTLLRKLNARDYLGAADEFGKWINAGGKPLKGLIRRREAERKLFLRPVHSRQPDDPGVEVPPDKPGGEFKAAGIIIPLILAVVAAAATFFFGR